MKRTISALLPDLAVSDRQEILNVELEADERVEFLWTNTNQGSYVSGYVVHKLSPLDDPVIAPCACCGFWP